ncbi:MAG TPA: hypothetical protein DCE14_07195 [Kosmotogaceae bacterium]|nr:hypothetical protein [Kosmotogaceae bacterium]
MSLAVVNVPKILSSRDVLYGKSELDSFLESARMEAISGSRKVLVYYRATDRVFFTSTGKTFWDSNVISEGDFRISYNQNGAVAILSGSTTLTYRDGSRLTISPVTGRVSY